MAITSAMKLSDFSGFLTPTQSAPIFLDAQRQSVVQRLAQQVPLGASGMTVPVISGRPVANWTTEGAMKPSTKGGMTLIPMVPKKLAAICVNSMEVVRANPGGYVTWLQTALAEAFATAFDYAALYNLGGDGTGVGPFASNISATTKSVEIGTGASIYNDITAGGKLLAADERKLTGFAFDDSAEWLFLDQVDASKRPLFNPSTAVGLPGTMVGRPVTMAEGVGQGTTLGFGGDFRKAAWGVVGGISYAASDQASVTINGTLTSAFENNLIVIRAEAEYGFITENVENFVKYVNVTP